MFGNYNVVYLHQHYNSMENETVKLEHFIYPETISDYKDILVEYLTGKDITRVHKELGVSKSTIYTYLNGGVPDNQASRNTENKILCLCKSILLERSELLVNTFKTETPQI